MKISKFFGFIPMLALGHAGLLTTQAHAHGWSEYPAARQQICYEQGGLWSGSPPNAACAEAKAISGTYPFVQRNEFSINLANYNSREALYAALPDGTLCYANDEQKRGFGVPRDDWTRTELATGTFEYVFNATAPHNPSFWEFYLTKPSADLTQPLAWTDLELIQTTGNVEVDNGKYRIDLTIPAERQGNAVLLVRWQREDPVGEGFYNCSDITINNDSVAPNEPEQPDPETGPYLIQGDSFIPSNITIDSVSIGDTVYFEVLNKYQEQHSSFSLEINADNINDWDRLLAAEVNGYYDAFYNGNVYIGRWHEEMNHYMYFMNDLQNNFFNSKDARASGRLSIQTADQDDDISLAISAKVISTLVHSDVNYGDKLILVPSVTGTELSEGVWQQIAGQSIDYQIDEANQITLDTSLLNAQSQTLSFSLSVAGSQAQAIFSFNVIVEGEAQDQPDTGTPIWAPDTVYTQGDEVMHQGRSWTAHWWTRGEEPGTTGEWGVWR